MRSETDRQTGNYRLYARGTLTAQKWMKTMPMNPSQSSAGGKEIVELDLCSPSGSLWRVTG